MTRSNLFITYFSPVSCYFFFLSSNTNLNTLSSNPLNLHIFPRFKDQVSHPYHTYISIRLRSHRDMPMQAQRGGGDMAPTHSQLSTRRRWVVSTTLRKLYPRKRLVTDCRGGLGGSSGRFESHGNSHPTRIIPRWSPQRVARRTTLSQQHKYPYT